MYDKDDNSLGRLWDAIVEHTQGDLFWIGEILLVTLEKETGYSKPKVRPIDPMEPAP